MYEQDEERHFEGGRRGSLLVPNWREFYGSFVYSFV
jgi:hypothetical protein